MRVRELGLPTARPRIRRFYPLEAERLKITRPSLAAVKDHREASTFSLMIVALVEHGDSLRLDEVADRFAEAGIAPNEKALFSPQRSRPARAPIYRHGDLYEPDIHDEDLDLWLFRLGLRGSMSPRLDVVRPEPSPLPGPDVRLSPALGAGDGADPPGVQLSRSRGVGPFSRAGATRCEPPFRGRCVGLYLHRGTHPPLSAIALVRILRLHLGPPRARDTS